MAIPFIAAFFLAASVAGLGIAAYAYSLLDSRGAQRIRLDFSDWILIGFLISSSLFMGILAAKFFAGISVFYPTIVSQILLIISVYIFKKFASSKVIFDFSIGRGFINAALVFYFFSLFIVLISGLEINFICEKFLGIAAEQQNVIDVFLAMDSTSEKIAAIVSITLFAPFAEELVFRGIIYRALKGAGIFAIQRLNIAFAACVSASLFAAIHLSAFAFLPLFFMGLLLVGAYEKRGSISLPIAVHSLFNITNIIFLTVSESV